MPQISVIIPVYNGEKTIERTIASVLQQTFQDFEIVVINDGSRDRTVEIVESIADPRIHLHSYSNAGTAVSRNRGLDLAKGEYLAFLDADDLWTSDKLEAQFNALQVNADAAVAYSWTDYIDEADRFARSGLHRNFNGDVLAEILVENFLENGSNPLIERRVLAKVNSFNPAIVPAEDWDFYIRLAEHFHFVVIPRSQILYRISPFSSSANLIRQERQCRKAIDNTFERVPRSLQHLKNECLSNLYKYLACKSFETAFSRKHGLLSLKFTLFYARYESWKEEAIKLIFVLFVKSILLFVLGNHFLNRTLKD